MKEHPTNWKLLALGAIGIVYGDIGTSPIYAMRESFGATETLEVTEANVLGILSMITWALILVVTLKYLVFVMRADHDGEGGILALTALVEPERKPGWWGTVLFLLGLFGAGLLYGDGMITPAISVLSAVEGVTLAAPSFQPWVIPTTLAILVLLFTTQRFGSSKIGAVFGPVMTVWFLIIAALGVGQVVQHPGILRALSPHYAVAFFVQNGFSGLGVLGGVFLVATGAEAVYADLGHFGKKPIRVAWLGLVLPSLLLNYYGQGALLVADPGAIDEPFFRLAPRVLLYPLIGVATLATVIASQAVIAGAFSLTYQATQFGFAPRIKTVHTSEDEVGQIYVPSVNWMLMFCTIGLVLGFRTSSALASAYGVAVTTTMVITTILAYVLAREKWGWSLSQALPFLIGFLTLDLAFFSANVLKIPSGGWFPLAVGVVILMLFTTWRKGRLAVASILRARAPSVSDFIAQLREHPPARVPGVGIFMSAQAEGTPAAIVHHLEHIAALHRLVVFMTVISEEVPRISVTDRVKVDDLGEGIFRVVLHVGYSQRPNVPSALQLCESHGLQIDPSEATYYFGREVVVRKGGFLGWREALFALMVRNSAPATMHFGIPSEQVVEVGERVSLS